jgi:hypothetical protein
MAGRKRRWVTIVIAVGIAAGMVGIAAIGGAAYFVSSHVQTEFVDAAPAGTKLAQSRRRFSGEQPLIDIRDGQQPALEALDSRAQPPSATKPQELRAMAYEPGARKLVDVTIPFWLLRLAPRSTDWSFLSDNGIAIDSKRIRLTVADLERLGPRLVIDHRAPDGQQVLVWTQ